MASIDITARDLITAFGGVSILNYVRLRALAMYTRRTVDRLVASMHSDTSRATRRAEHTERPPFGFTAREFETALRDDGRACDIEVVRGECLFSLSATPQADRMLDRRLRRLLGGW